MIYDSGLAILNVVSQENSSESLDSSVDTVTYYRLEDLRNRIRLGKREGARTSPFSRF
jgi:hypothetical protein